MQHSRDGYNGMNLSTRNDIQNRINDSDIDSDVDNDGDVGFGFSAYIPVLGAYGQDAHQDGYTSCSSSDDDSDDEDESMRYDGCDEAVVESDNLIRTSLEGLKDELDAIDDNLKVAWNQAQSKCPELVGDDHRLLFLRCERFDVELAALRLLRYWEKRLELFGSDKAFLPMTLDGALRDDTVALEMGFIAPTGHYDDKGRAILLKDHSGMSLSAKQMDDKTQTDYHDNDASDAISCSTLGLNSTDWDAAVPSFFGLDSIRRMFSQRHSKSHLSKSMAPSSSSQQSTTSSRRSSSSSSSASLASAPTISPQGIQAAKKYVRRISMMRCIWYALHVALEDNVETQRHGVVLLLAVRHFSCWHDLDRVQATMMTELLGGCIPVRLHAIHVCHAPRLLRALVPLYYNVKSLTRWQHAQIVYHSGARTVRRLQKKTGLTTPQIPTVVGGDHVLDYDAWLQQRRTVEAAAATAVAAAAAATTTPPPPPTSTRVRQRTMLATPPQPCKKVRRVSTSTIPEEDGK